MKLVTLNRAPSSRQLLVFSLAWTAFLGALAWIAWRREQPNLAALAATTAGMMPLLWCVARPATRWAYVGLTCATYPVGVVVSYALLAVLYYGVMTPVGWAMRLSGHDPLARRFDREKTTYWMGRGPARAVAIYFRQW